jgi:hypothetical protein
MRIARTHAGQFATNVLPIIRDIQAAGHSSLKQWWCQRLRQGLPSKAHFL